MAMPHIAINSESVADALTTHDWEKPSSDVTNSVSQEAIADSILDAPIVGDHRRWNVDSVADESRMERYPNEQIDFLEEYQPVNLLDDVEQSEEEQEPLDEGALRQQLADEFGLNHVLEQPETPSQEGEQPQYTEPTLEEYRQASAGLDQVVQQIGLANPEDATELVTGSDGQIQQGVNAQALDGVLSKLFISACADLHNCRGDLSNLAPTSDQAAADFHGSLMLAGGVDPRLVNNNTMDAANVARGAMINIVQTLDRLGPDAALHQINDPRATEFYVNAFLKAYGSNPVSREEALEIGDTFTRYVIAKYRRGQEYVQQNPVRERSRKSGRKQFATNDEIFGDPEVLERIGLERL